MKKIIFIIGTVIAFGVRADFSADSSDSKITMFVYDETISRAGDIVRYTAGVRNNDGSVTTRTYDTAYNCVTHRDSSSFLAPETLGRSAADYACNFSKNETAQSEPIIDNITYQEQSSKSVWVRYNEAGIRMTATDSPCISPVLANLGFPYTMVSAIPIARLKKPQDAYATDGQFAITVVGCWSPAKHSYIAVRKHDQKVLTDDNFHIDGAWTKQESRSGVKS